MDHISQIVNRLIFDNKIEVLALTVEQRKRYTEPGPFYRPTPQEVSHYDFLTSMPCGVCPVFDQCTPGGVISPQSCVYFDHWLDESQQDDGMAVDATQPADPVAGMF